MRRDKRRVYLTDAGRKALERAKAGKPAEVWLCSSPLCTEETPEPRSWCDQHRPAAWIPPCPHGRLVCGPDCDSAPEPAADAALGRSPAVLPGQKQGAASEPPPPELQPYEKASCRQCKALLRELGAATDAFTEFTRPRLRRYAAMSYGQVLEFKAQVAPLSKRVKAAREAYEKHAEVCL